ncbi:MAG: tetratricopeptide repeat protein [Candidatus Sedimenticola sp. (ex Thyasira tokunagai)]
MSVPVRILATAVLVIFAGTGVLVWHLGDPQNDTSALVHVEAENDDSPISAADHLLAYNQASDASAATEPFQGLRLDPQSEPQSEAQTEAQTEAQPEAQPEAQAEVQPEPQPRPQFKPQQAAATLILSTVVDEAVDLARVALSRGQYQQALSALHTLKPVPDRRADFWLVKGSAHLGLGQLDMAESAFTSAQSLAPNNAQISVQRAIIKQEMGDHANALETLQDAAVRHPDVPEVFLNLGYSQQALGAMRDARSSFRIFLRLTEGRSLYSQQRTAVKQWLAQFRTFRE